MRLACRTNTLSKLFAWEETLDMKAFCTIAAIGLSLMGGSA